jgi:hypothetical protein
VGNQATLRFVQSSAQPTLTVTTPDLLQRSDPNHNGHTEQPTLQPTVRFSVSVGREMDAREFLIEFAVQYPNNEVDTREAAIAGIESGEIYWVDKNGHPIAPEAGPKVVQADIKKGYKLVTVYAPGVSPLSEAGLDDLREEFYALGDDDQADINQQTNQLFWQETSYKEGHKLDPKHDADDRKMAQDWLRLRAHVVQSRQAYFAQPEDVRQQLYELIPPAARPFMFREGGTGTLAPKDFVTALNIANKIAGLTAAEREEYLSRVTGVTNSWDAFEQAIDRYIDERGARGEAGEEREEAKTQLFGADDLYSAYQNYVGLRDAAMMAPDDNLALDRMVAEAWEELQQEMEKHGFKSIQELEAWLGPRVEAFEAAFEKEALFVAREMLDRYLHVLYIERERILVPEELDIFYGKLAAAGNDLEQLIEEYPLLRDEDLRDDLDGVLTKARALEILLFHITQRKEDIAKTRSNLEENPELVYGFDVLRQHAMLAQGIDENSLYYGIIIKKKNDIERRQLIKSFMLAIVAIAAGLLTGGGGAVAVLGGATAAGIGIYETLEEYRRYEIEHTAHSAGLLSSDPSFAWVIVAAVGAGLDMAAVSKALRTMKPALQAFNETGDVVALEAKLAKLTDVEQGIKNSVLEAAKAEARAKHAWQSILKPAPVLHAVIVPGGEQFAQLVYAVYLTLKVHGHNLAAFLKTRQARQLLGELAENPAAHPQELAALREGFLGALGTQERITKHATQLGLRDFEIDNWFRVWAEHPWRSVDDLLAQMDHYAEPLKSGGGSKYRNATELMTDDETRKLLGEFDLRIAGRGGIETITGRMSKEGERVITIEGRVLSGIENRTLNAPNFNKSTSLFSAKELGLSANDWEWAHLWGPGFGDEAAAGLMLAPKEVNQVFQNRGIEGYIRDIAEKARAVGAEVRVKASATSWGSRTPGGWEVPKGVDFLQRAEYRITLELPDGSKHIAEVTLEAAEPPASKLLSKAPEGTELDEILEAHAVGAL